MKIAILSRGPKLYSTSRLVEAGIERGHDARVINPLRCYMNISSSRPTIHYRGEELEEFDAVIPRIGASVTFYGTAVLCNILSCAPAPPSAGAPPGHCLPII